MKPERWRQVTEVFHAARSRDAAARAPYLEQACADDFALRAEVDAMLAAHQDPGGFGDRPVSGSIDDVRRFEAGAMVGAYRIDRLIGAGGMGEVYRARDTKLGRDVAIKVLPDAFTSDPERLARFEREARLLAALNHPHIGAIYSLEEFQGVPALVLELVDGPTLADRLAADQLHVDEALTTARQIADALEAAHAKGITHRDLKPTNIKIAAGDIVKVLDFGLAKASAGEGARSDVSQMPTVTMTAAREGTIVGTPAYMSPEQARGKPVDRRTDIWAFGCVLYEMLTGYVAFAGETVFDTIAAILEREPDWKALPEATPAGVRRLLRRCLEKDVQRRLRDIGDARIEIEEALHAAAIGASSESDRVIQSLAVLPFVNANGDPQMEYLSDGLTESIILSLSQLSQLRVMARSTVFRYKGRGEEAQEIGQALGVGAVATGRVSQRGETLIISAELVDVEKGWQIWGAQYRRAVADIFAIEEDIAREISGKLCVKLTLENETLLAKRYTENVEAYHLYLKGKFYWAKRTEEGLNRGIQYFRQAIEMDPTYALAYAGLAEGYVPMGYYGHLRPTEALRKAQVAAQKALEIDPALSEARTVLAGTKWLCEWDVSGAEKELRAVIERHPNYPRARQVLAETLLGTGRFGEAVAEATRALELDPLSLSNNLQVAAAHYYARHYDEAIEGCRRTIEMDSTFYPAHWILGMAYEQKGQFSEATAELRQAGALSNNSTFMVATLGGVYAAWGKKEEARNILGELEELASRKYVSQVLVAVILCGLGEKDRALTCLERAYEERCPQLVMLKVNPRLDALRAESRFQSLMRRMGFM